MWWFSIKRSTNTLLLVHRVWMWSSWRLPCGYQMRVVMLWWSVFQFCQLSLQRRPSTSKRALMMLSQSGVSIMPSAWLIQEARYAHTHAYACAYNYTYNHTHAHAYTCASVGTRACCCKSYHGRCADADVLSTSVMQLCLFGPPSMLSPAAAVKFLFLQSLIWHRLLHLHLISACCPPHLTCACSHLYALYPSFPHTFGFLTQPWQKMILYIHLTQLVHCARCVVSLLSASSLLLHPSTTAYAYAQHSRTHWWQVL